MKTPTLVVYFQSGKIATLKACHENDDLGRVFAEPGFTRN
jgi:hypothetical protein